MFHTKRVFAAPPHSSRVYSTVHRYMTLLAVLVVALVAAPSMAFQALVVQHEDGCSGPPFQLVVEVGQCIQLGQQSSARLNCTSNTAESSWTYNRYNGGDCSGVPTDQFQGNSTGCFGFLNAYFISVDCSYVAATSSSTGAHNTGDASSLRSWKARELIAATLVLSLLWLYAL